MRYPLQAHKKELATADEAREREKELAKEIISGEYGFFRLVNFLSLMW